MSRTRAGRLVPASFLLSLAVTAAAQPATWEPRGPGGGGALFAPSLSPHRPGEMYVACDMSELFHTTDMGRTWSQSDFRTIQADRETKVFFTEDPAVLYTIDRSTIALTEYRRPVRSTDGGLTWQPLPGDPTGGTMAEQMLVDPRNGDRVFVVRYDWGTNEGTLWFSDDAGSSFRNVYTDATGSGCIVAGLFAEGDLLFVGTNAGLLVSTDAGQTFQLNPGIGGIDWSAAGEGMTGFAGAAEAGRIRLLCVTAYQGDFYVGMDGADHWSYLGVYTLDWGQPNWVSRTNGLDVEAHPYYAAMTGTDVDTMWLAGGNEAGEPIVYVSGTGGSVWGSVFQATNNANVVTGWSGSGGDRGWGYGEYALGLTVSSADPRRAAFSDLGFVHVTEDGGATWRQAYTDAAHENPAGSPTPQRQYYGSIGLENTTSWWLTWADAATLVGCYSDIRGTRSEDGGATWGFDYSGHAANSMYHCVRHPGTGTLYAATSSIHDLYQSTRLRDGILDPGTGAVLMSLDGGSTWTTMRDFGDIVAWLALDPNDANTILASVVNRAGGTGGIWRSRDIDRGAASTWTQLPAPPRTEGHPFNVHVLADGTIVATYSGRRGGSPEQFTPSSGVFVSVDGGASWLDRSDPGMRYWTKDLVIDPADPTQSTWYVGVWSGWGGPPNGLGGLYRTRDRGQSWIRVNDLDRVTSIAVDPANQDHAYMTTEMDGLWHSTNLSAAGPAFTQVAEYPFRQPERVFFNPHDPLEIWVTSFGNGLRVGRNGAQAPVDLLRNTMVTTLNPVTPPLDTVLPLSSPRDLYMTDVSPGVVDPDPTVVGDPNRPLAFYQVTGDVVIRLTLSPGRLIGVSWTPR